VTDVVRCTKPGCGLQSSPRTLRFDVKVSSFDFLDLGKQGATVGDETLFSDVLLRNGKRVGKQAGFRKVTALTSDGFDVDCLSTVSLPVSRSQLRG
jgi:hypothetical protein